MSVKPVPEGYTTVTPYLTVSNTLEALQFYNKAFGAVETMRLPMPDGSIAHAEMKIGDSIIMLSDESVQWGNLSPLTLGGTPGAIMLYVDECDAMFKQAIDAGATVKFELQDQFYGDRSGSVMDPYGHRWSIATHIEDVPPMKCSVEWMLGLPIQLTKESPHGHDNIDPLQSLAPLLGGIAHGPTANHKELDLSPVGDCDSHRCNGVDPLQVWHPSRSRDRPSRIPCRRATC